MEEKIYTKSSASVCWFRNHQTGAKKVNVFDASTKRLIKYSR